MNIKEDVAYAEYDGLMGWRKNDKDAALLITHPCRDSVITSNNDQGQSAACTSRHGEKCKAQTI